MCCEEQDRASINILSFNVDVTCRLPTREVTLWRGVGVDLFEQYKASG